MVCNSNVSAVKNPVITESDVLAITETYRVYLFLDEETKSKIPQKFKDFLETYKNLDVGEELHPEVPLEMQNISQEGWNLIAQIGTFLN